MKLIRLTLLFAAFTLFGQSAVFPQSDAGEYLCELGIRYYQEKRFEDAFLEFKKALLIDPDNQTAKDYINKIASKQKAIAEEMALEEKVASWLFERERTIKEALDRAGKERLTRAKEKALSKKEELLPREEDVFPEKEEEVCKEIIPVEISGEVQVGLGITSDEVIWRDANADKQGVPGEKNWRFLWGQQRYNAFDSKIYSSLKMDFQTKTKGPLNAYMQLVVDPWSFVGTTKVRAWRTQSVRDDGVIIPDPTPDDYVDMELKYWANTGYTIDEVYRSDAGNIINISELKVSDNKISRAFGNGVSENWGGGVSGYGQFEVTQSEINRLYRPIRQLWLDYNQEDYKFRIFPIAYHDQALTSDDPLRLSNNHVYWEESPWLDEYEPSRVFTRSGNPLKKGRWIRRLSFYAQDSQQQRLTFLRGFSFDYSPYDYASFKVVAATPMSLWDEYEESNSIHSAYRLNYKTANDIDFGFLYTQKLGLSKGNLEAENHTWAVDVGNDLDVGRIYAELALSDTEVDEAAYTTTSYDGFAFMLGLKNDEKWNIYFTHMDDDFYPALSNYRYTRWDRYFAQHIQFSPLDPEDEAIKLGDGIDRGRNTIGFRWQEDFFQDKLNNDFNFYNVHKDSGEYVETVVRNESICKLNPKLTGKILLWYKDLPKTQAGFDPLIYAKTSYSLTDYFSEEDIFLRNDQVEGGKDPSIGHFSLGMKYDFFDWLSAEGIYERTNDPGDFPRGLLNTSWYEDEVIDGITYDKVVPSLYDQMFFDLPPYNYYSIVRMRFILQALDNLKFIFSATKNSNKYEAGIDDNVNHFGLEVDYQPNQKLSLGFKYTYSRMNDLYEQVKRYDEIKPAIPSSSYRGHHNLFLSAQYHLNADETFEFLFGEFVGYNDPYFAGKWSLSALDTQHLVRLYYRRKF